MATTTVMTIDDIFECLKRDIQDDGKLSSFDKGVLNRAVRKAQLAQRCSCLKPAPDMSEKRLRQLAADLTDACLIVMVGDGEDISTATQLWPMAWRLSSTPSI